MSPLADANLLVVGLVLGAVALVLAALSRRARGGPLWGRTPEVVVLTPQHRLHVVEIAGRRLLVGTGPSGAPRLVCGLDDDAGLDRLAGRTGSVGPRLGSAQTTERPGGA